MANANLSLIQYANTFDYWRIVTNNLANSVNQLRNGVFVVDNGQLVLSTASPGIVIQNNSGTVLTVGGDEQISNTLFSNYIVNSADLTSSGNNIIFNNPNNLVQIANTAQTTNLISNTQIWANNLHTNGNVYLSNTVTPAYVANANIGNLSGMMLLTGGPGPGGEYWIANANASLNELHLTGNTYTSGTIFNYGDYFQVRALNAADGDGGFLVYRGNTGWGAESNAALRFWASQNVWSVSSNDATDNWHTMITMQNVSSSTTSNDPLNVASLQAIYYVASNALGAYAQANGAYAQANGAYGQANGAYLQANVVYGASNTVYAQANAAYNQANAARNQANTGYGQANAAYGQANAAYGQANTATTIAENAYNTANNATSLGEYAYTQANNAYAQANVSINAYNEANAAYGQANAAYNQANSAYAAANVGISNAGHAYDYANTVSGIAQYAYDQANTATSIGENAYNTANNALSGHNLQPTSIYVGAPNHTPTYPTGQVTAEGNIVGYYSSDAKFKENIKDITNALQAVMNIGGKTFDWTDEYIESHGGKDDYFMRKSDFGMIAQDVEKAFPLAVRKRADGSLALDYEKMTALAFAAIKELSEKVVELENKLENK